MAARLGLDDTDERSRARYYELLSQRTVAERGAILVGLNAMVRRLTELSVRQAHPSAGENEVRARIAARLYGPAVAARLFPDESID